MRDGRESITNRTCNNYRKYHLKMKSCTNNNLVIKKKMLN